MCPRLSGLGVGMVVSEDNSPSRESQQHQSYISVTHLIYTIRIWVADNRGAVIFGF
jgi:hypothetical protein